MTRMPSRRSGGRRDVLEPYLSAGYFLAVFGAGDGHLPELLAAALDYRLGDHIHPASTHGTQEVRVVVEADGVLVPVLSRPGRPQAGRSLDRRRVDAAVNHAPRLMVILVELDPTLHPSPVHLRKPQPRDPQ